MVVVCLRSYARISFSLAPVEIMAATHHYCGETVTDFAWAMNKLRDGKRVRRHHWARVMEYTPTTPPVNYERAWHLWLQSDTNSIINGWGRTIGCALDDDPIRDGMEYVPTEADETANDWELHRGWRA